MATEISGGIWTAVGRLCVDDDFSATLSGVTLDKSAPRPSTGDSEGLDQQLKDLGFLLGLGATIDFHLLVWKLKSLPDTTIVKLQQRYAVALRASRLPDVARSSNFYAAIGLACIDGTYRERLEKASFTRAAFDAELAKSPGFVPETLEVPTLRELFRDPQFRSALEKTHDKGWRDPAVMKSKWPDKCKERLEFSREYFHIDTPKVINMVHSLYLSLNNSVESDPEAMRSKLVKIHSVDEIHKDSKE